jgi:hypothetical protein
VTAQYSGDLLNSASTNSLTQIVTNYPPPVAATAYYTRVDNTPLQISISSLLTNVTDANGFTISFVGVGTDGLNDLTTNGATLLNEGAYILYTNSVPPYVNDSFKYTVSDGHGNTTTGTVIVFATNNPSGPAAPVITWATPAPITYGTALSSNQLNATANVPGSFAYNPPIGTVLNEGTNLLSVNFTPNDTVDYSSATASVGLVVTPQIQNQGGEEAGEPLLPSWGVAGLFAGVVALGLGFLSQRRTPTS